MCCCGSGDCRMCCELHVDVNSERCGFVPGYWVLWLM